MRSDPEAGLSWAQIAVQAGRDGLVANVEFKGDHATFPFGAHVAVVELDTETGKVRHVRHVTVDDAGPARRSATGARSAARSPTATRPPTCRR